MAHDFANRRSGNGRRKKKAGSTGPVWLFVGVLCGLFLAFLLQLGGYNLAPVATAPVERSTAAPAADSVLITNKQATQVPKKPRFEFYSKLPEATVEVLEEADVPVVESAPAAAVQSPASQPVSKSPADSSAAPSSGKEYILQAGSFKRRSDADRHRAKLLLMGLEVNIEKVRLNAFDSRHRVQVGPFASRLDMAATRKKLNKAKIDTLVLERKKP